VRKAPGVVRVSPNNVNTICSTPNDALRDLWGLNNPGTWGSVVDADIDAPEAWDLTTGSGDVVVAVIDSGAAYTHRDLAANMWVNPGEVVGDGIDNDNNGYIDDIHGIDTCSDDSDPWDENGHGTHVAGVAAAVGNNGLDVTGVAWQAKIMALRFLGADGSGEDVDAIECIYYAIDMKQKHGVNVVAINASWGSYGGYDDALFDAIKAAGEAEIVFCTAAGNDSTNTDVVPFYPAEYPCPCIVSVGASDAWDTRAFFDNAGGSNYGATSVDLFAPGKSILSTVPGYTFYYPEAGDPFFDDMESGPDQWVAEGTWAISTEAHASGTHAWSDSPDAKYQDGSDSSLSTRSLDLRALTAHDAVAGFCALTRGRVRLADRGGVARWGVDVAHSRLSDWCRDRRSLQRSAAGRGPYRRLQSPL
jgi:subtilisin family serine protease